MSPLMRWLSGGLVAALVLAVGVTWYLNRPRWEVFYKANDPAEVTSLTESLDGLKVQYRVTGDGLTIQVPSSERSAANLAKAQSGLPNSGQVGLELFNEPKFGATEFDKKVNLKRATEGELARTLMRIADIQYAKVDLVTPDQSVFIRDKQQPSASVMVKPRPGRTLSKENVRAIINYVTGAVEGLNAERVTVINDKAEDLSTGVLQEAGTAGMDAEALAQQQSMAKHLRESLLSVLEPMFGTGNVAATVTVQLDRESRRTEETVLGQGVPKATEVERSGAQSNSTTAAQPGTTTGQTAGGTNPPPVYQQQQTGQGASDEYSSKTSTQYDYGKKSQVTVSPAGTPKRITAAITINRQDLTAGMIEQVKQVATSATQAVPEDVAVMAMSFSLPPGAAEQATAKAAGGIQPTTLAIVMGLVSLLLMLAFFITRRRAPEPEPVFVGLGAQPAAGTRLDVALGLSSDGVAQPGAPAAQAAAASMDGLQSQAPDGQEGQKEEAVRTIETIIKKRKRPALVMEEIDNDALADIDVLIDQTPEACAEVIRQWLKGGI